MSTGQDDGARLQVTVVRTSDGDETIITFYSNRKGQSQGHSASLTDPASALRDQDSASGERVKDSPQFQRGEEAGGQELTAAEREARRELLVLIKSADNPGEVKRSTDPAEPYLVSTVPSLAVDPDADDLARVEAVIAKLPKPERVLYTETAVQARAERARLAALPVDEQPKVIAA